MTALWSRFSLPALVGMAGLASFVAAPLAAQAVSNSAEFEAWRKVQKEDIDGLREKFMALAKAVPANKLGWRPMEGPGPSTTYSPTSPPRETPRRQCSVANCRRDRLPTSTPRRPGSASSRTIN